MPATGINLRDLDLPTRFSYAFIAGTLILAGWLHLGSPFVIVLFAYFSLNRLHFFKQRARYEEPLANNLFSLCAEAIAARFRTFYSSFATVMGAQVVISTINTVLTAIFVLATHLPYAAVVIGATFLCGLLPIVGNLVSN